MKPSIELIPLIDRQSGRFQVRERVFKIKQIAHLAYEHVLEENLRRAMDKVIEEDQDAQDNDKLYVNIASSRYNFGSWNLPVIRWKEDHGKKEFRSMFERIFEFDFTLTISITRARV